MAGGSRLSSGRRRGSGPPSQRLRRRAGGRSSFAGSPGWIAGARPGHFNGGHPVIPASKRQRRFGAAHFDFRRRRGIAGIPSRCLDSFRRIEAPPANRDPLGRPGDLFWWEVVAPGRQAMGERFRFEKLSVRTRIESPRASAVVGRFSAASQAHGHATRRLASASHSHGKLLRDSRWVDRWRTCGRWNRD